MRAHREMMKRLAVAIADDENVRAYAVANFGRGLDVHVGAYPSGIPGVDDSPFCWITPQDENEDHQADERFAARLVVAGCVVGPHGEKVIEDVIRPRTVRQNGVVVNGGNEIVERLRDLILAVARDARVGAVVSACRREENDISHFPLEWAVAYIEYFEPEALG